MFYAYQPNDVTLYAYQLVKKNEIRFMQTFLFFDVVCPVDFFAPAKKVDVTMF